MSFGDSAHWRARAVEMRALAEEASGGISRHLMHKIADDYERMAQTMAQRPNRFPPTPRVVPAAVRRFAPRKKPADAKAADTSRGARAPELPDFLKRGPATADDLGSL